MPKRIKTVDELTFTDDGMFQAVLREPDICAELVERLLDIRVEHVEYPELEKAIAPFYTTKGVRLDVYLKDSGKIIDVEMQSHPLEALGKRTRYYQSMVDMDSLMKGESYKRLKESYILFICKHDPFKDESGKAFGLPRYTFRNSCQENKSVNLDDKSLKVIYNSSAYEAESDARIRDFLRFVQTNEPGQDDFSNRLSAIVEKTKENEKFKQEYAAMNLHDRDLIDETRKEALAEGAQQKAVEDAVTLVKKYNAAPETAAADVGAPLEKVLEALSAREE